MAKSPAAASITTEQDVRDKLVPVVLGADILGYTYVREFNRVYGLSSIVLSSADIKVTSSSRFCDYRIVPGADSADDLIPYLHKLARKLAGQGKVGLLLGCGDFYARIFSEHKAELEQEFVVPYIDFSLLDDITQKERFYQLCEELNIDYPRTVLLDCADPAATLDVDAFSYPLIAKPSNSARYHYAEFPGKKKVFEVETPEELSEILENIKRSSYDRQLVIQEFIPGGDEGLHSLTTFSDDSGKLCLSCMGQVVLQDHEPSALGNPVVIRSKWVNEIVDAAARFLEHVGYHGFANFDIKYDPRDGRYKFFEINTRPGRNTFYVSLAGVDFVRYFVEDYVLGHAPEVIEARGEFCYACVPPYVVRRSVEDPVLRDEVLDFYRRGVAQFPLFYDKDTTTHWMWAEITYYHQITKFKRFLWDTDGHQAKVE